MDTKWMPSVAGILNIISGVVSLLGSLIMALVVGVFFSSSYDSYSGQEYSAILIWVVLFLPFIIISLLAITGGVFALRKKLWGLALAGSIGSILTIWAWPLGVASVIFVSLSKNEFDRHGDLFPAGVIPPPSSPTDQSQT
jgi:hypothetical protein